MLKQIIAFLELFYFSIYNWLKNNASNWEAGPELMSSGLIGISMIGNIIYLSVKTNRSHPVLIFLSILIILIFNFYLTFYYNDEERFELIGERYEQLSKLQKIIIKNVAFLYIVLSFYSFYLAISLSG